MKSNASCPDCSRPQRLPCSAFPLHRGRGRRGSLIATTGGMMTNSLQTHFYKRFEAETGIRVARRSPSNFLTNGRVPWPAHAPALCRSSVVTADAARSDPAGRPARDHRLRRHARHRRARSTQRVHAQRHHPYGWRDVADLVEEGVPQWRSAVVGRFLRRCQISRTRARCPIPETVNGGCRSRH